MQHLDPVTLASFIAAGALAASRLLTTLKPAWNFLPASLQGLVPMLVLVLPQIAAAALGVHTSIDLANLIALSVALVLPGIHSHTVQLTKPSAPAATLIVLTLAFSTGQACSNLPAVSWPKVLSCMTPLEQPLIDYVAKVLAGSGDVQTALEALAKDYAPGLIECAVQQIIDSLSSSTKADASHSIARGQAFLAKVTK